MLSQDSSAKALLTVVTVEFAVSTTEGLLATNAGFTVASGFIKHGKLGNPMKSPNSLEVSKQLGRSFNFLYIFYGFQHMFDETRGNRRVDGHSHAIAAPPAGDAAQPDPGPGAAL